MEQNSARQIQEIASHAVDEGIDTVFRILYTLPDTRSRTIGCIVAMSLLRNKVDFLIERMGDVDPKFTGMAQELIGILQAVDKTTSRG